MALYAIIRQDGEIDQAEGTSISDVAERYGWPGNGEIVEWDDKEHKAKLRHTFSSPDDQYAEWLKVHQKETGGKG